MLHPRRFLICAAAHRRPKRPLSSRRIFGQSYLSPASRCPGVQNGAIVALPDVSPLGTDINPTPLTTSSSIGDYAALLAESADTSA